jgi:hypothetical protein
MRLSLEDLGYSKRKFGKLMKSVFVLFLNWFSFQLEVKSILVPFVPKSILEDIRDSPTKKFVKLSL